MPIFCTLSLASTQTIRWSSIHYFVFYNQETQNGTGYKQCASHHTLTGAEAFLWPPGFLLSEIL
jgi:hypothetical protein